MSAPVLDERQFQLALKNRDFRQARIEELRREVAKYSSAIWKDWLWIFLVILPFSFWQPEHLGTRTNVMLFLIVMGVVWKTARQFDARFTESELRWLLAVDSILETEAERHSEALHTDAPQ